jgi:hypothetical protein
MASTLYFLKRENEVKSLLTCLAFLVAIAFPSAWAAPYQATGR